MSMVLWFSITQWGVRSLLFFALLFLSFLSYYLVSFSCLYDEIKMCVTCVRACVHVCELEKRRPSSRENMLSAKTYTVISVFWRNLVTLKDGIPRSHCYQQEAQLSQRDRAVACLNFGKNISAKSVHLTLLYVKSVECHYNPYQNFRCVIPPNSIKSKFTHTHTHTLFIYRLCLLYFYTLYKVTLLALIL